MILRYYDLLDLRGVRFDPQQRGMGLSMCFCICICSVGLLAITIPTYSTA